MTFERKWTPERLAELTSLRDQGMSQRQAADHFRLTWSGMHSVIAMYKIEWPAVWDGLWNQERTDFMVAAYLGGKSSEIVAREMNRKFGLSLTKSAVIGKLHRLKIRRPTPPTISRLSDRPKVVTIRKVPYKPRPKPRPAPILVVVPEHWRMLKDLKPRCCKYPMAGESCETLFCAQPVEGERPYCAGHAAVAYQPATKAAAAERKANWQARRFA